MEVHLVVANTSSNAKQIRLGPQTLIGRSPECNLRIASGQVSRRHCLIKVGDSTVSVRDLGSANGTRLNGEPVSTQGEVAVPPGSSLVVGPLKFIVQFAAPRAIDDEDTELLSGVVPRKPAGENEVASLVPPRAADGEETKDLPASRRRAREAPPQVVVTRAGPAADPGGEPDSVLTSNVDPGTRTVPDLAALAGETVFDVSLEQLGGDPAAVAAAALRKKASETHLIFEEDDLKQMIADGDVPPAALTEDSDSASTDDGLDDDLRKFLSGS